MGVKGGFHPSLPLPFPIRRSHTGFPYCRGRVFPNCPDRQGLLDLISNSNMNETDRTHLPSWSTSQVILATLFVVAVGLVFWFLYSFRAAVFILIVAIVLGTAIRPAVEWLQRRGLSRPVGVILIYVLLIGSMLGVGAFIFPLIANQTTDLAVQIPKLYSSTRTWMLESSGRLLKRIALSLPAQLQLFSPPVDVEGEPLTRAAQTFTLAGSVIRSLLAANAVFLVAFYWTMESERTMRTLLLFFPPDRREDLRRLLEQIEAKVGGFIRGQFILSLSIGTAALIAYWLIGLPNTLVLALFAAIMEAVPVFGPALGAIPAALIAASVDPTKVIWVIVATGIMQGLENYFLVPRVMNKNVGVNPIVTLLALAAFASLLGLPGGLLAIPAAAVVQLLLDRYLLERLDWDQHDPPGRDYINLLRYEAQDLAQDVRKQIRSDRLEVENGEDHFKDRIEASANELDRLLAELDGRVQEGRV